MKNLVECLNEGFIDQAYGENKSLAKIVKDQVEKMTGGGEYWGSPDEIKFLTNLVTKFYEEFGTRSTFIFSEPDNVEDIEIVVNHQKDVYGDHFKFNPRKGFVPS